MAQALRGAPANFVREAVAQHKRANSIPLNTALRAQQEDSLRRLRGSRAVKSFGGGRQSQSVQLLENGLIAKRFDASKKHAEKFQAEIKNLKRVAGCGFVPQLVAVDEQQRTLYMTNVGDRPKRYTKKVAKQVRQNISVLRNKYHMERSFKPKRAGLPRLANVAVDTAGHVNLVDMGPPWHKTR